MTRADHNRAVPLVEPLGLHAYRTGGRSPALDPPLEDTRGIGEGGLIGSVLLVHLVPGRGAAQVGQAGAAEQAMGGIFMVQRGQDPAFSKRSQVALPAVISAMGEHFSGQAATVANGTEGQLAGVAGITDDLDMVAFNDADVTLAFRSFELDQAHCNGVLRLIFVVGFGPIPLKPVWPL